MCLRIQFCSGSGLFIFSKKVKSLYPTVYIAYALVYASCKGGRGYISTCFPVMRRLFPVTIPATIRIAILRTIQKVIRVTLTTLDLYRMQPGTLPR